MMAKESELVKRLKKTLTDADKFISSAKDLLDVIKPETPPDDQKDKTDERKPE